MNALVEPVRLVTPPPPPARRSIVAFFASAAIAYVCGGMFNYLMIVFARATGGSNGFSGLVYFAGFVIPLALAPVAGTLIDRHDRKWILFASQALWIGAATTIAVVEHRAHPGHAARWVPLAVAFGNGLGVAFYMPTRLAFGAEVVRPAHVARSALVLNVLLIIGFGLGPVTAGVLKQRFGWDVLFALVAASLTVSNALLLLARAHTKRRGAAADERAGATAAWAYLRRERVVARLLADAIVCYLPLGPIQVLVPQYAKQALFASESARGLLFGVIGIGLLVGGVVAFAANRSRRRDAILVGALVAFGGILALVPLSTTWSWPVVCLFLDGVAGGVAVGIIAAQLQARVAPDVRGRILSWYALITFTTPAVTALVCGPPSDLIGPGRILQLTGLVVAALAISRGRAQRPSA